MIEMCEVDRHVAERSAQFGIAQAAFNRERDALDAELYAAFRRLWSGKAGDRIRAVVASSGRLIEGRAVIMRNGTRMGLYVDTGHERWPVVEPWSVNAQILKQRKPPSS